MLFNSFFEKDELRSEFSKLEKEELLLFYNKDLISKPPLVWQELKEMVASGASVALGRAENIEYSAEILYLLSQQDNLTNALKFYTEFADKTKKVYNWDSSRENDLIEFKLGHLDMIFAKKSDNLPGLKSPFPKIDLSQKNQEFPLLAKEQKIIYQDMIEQVALKKMTAEQVVGFYGY